MRERVRISVVITFILLLVGGILLAQDPPTLNALWTTLDQTLSESVIGTGLISALNAISEGIRELDQASRDAVKAEDLFFAALERNGKALSEHQKQMALADTRRAIRSSRNWQKDEDEERAATETNTLLTLQDTKLGG